MARSLLPIRKPNPNGISRPAPTDVHTNTVKTSRFHCGVRLNSDFLGLNPEDADCVSTGKLKTTAIFTNQILCAHLATVTRVYLTYLASLRGDSLNAYCTPPLRFWNVEEAT